MVAFPALGYHLMVMSTVRPFRREAGPSAAALKDQAKAKWRDQALRRHLERPIEERLRAALALVLRRTDRERR
jgi:hypothetical protein